MNEHKITDSIILTIKDGDIIQTPKDTLTVLTIIHVKENHGEITRLLKKYHIWMTYEYISDHRRQRNDNASITELDRRDAAYTFFDNRFHDCNDTIPEENGVYLTSKGATYIDNIDTFTPPQSPKL